MRRASRWLRRGVAIRAVSWLAAVLVTIWALADDVQAQGPAPLVVRGPDGATASLPISRARGYASLDREALEGLGWTVESSAAGFRATTSDGESVVEFAFGIPLFRWNGEVLQLVDVPFTVGGKAHVPLQFVLDFLPVRLSERYAFLPEERVLQILDGATTLEGESSSGPAEPIPSDEDVSGASGEPPSPAPGGEALPDMGDADTSGEADASGGADAGEALPIKRVVIIDPGHGGKDPGTSGPGGRREKDIALAVGRALARELRGDERLEVHLTRDRDVLIPLWERGELATAWKGDRPGIFVSIHANALPNRSSVRGFETYFLSEARTEHERRVAANENAPLQIDRENGEVAGDDEDLGFILRELRNLDHTHWSSLLAEGVQRQLETVHPGPSRGVKQAPLAVITNALMPAVLVEVGFVTNREEERLLSRGEFQAQLAEAMGRAIRDFFERYPPGQGETVSGPRP